MRKRASSAQRPDHHPLGWQVHLAPLMSPPPAVADLCFAGAAAHEQSLGPASSGPRLLPASPAGSEVIPDAAAEATESPLLSESGRSRLGNA